MELITFSQRADVVLVFSDSGCTKHDISDETLFHVNAPIVETIAKTCVSTCPEAVFALLTSPLNSTVPLFAQVKYFCYRIEIQIVSLRKTPFSLMTS